MSDIELLNINGGAISGTLINAVAKLIGAFLEIGRTIGTAIRMARSKTKC